MMGMEVSDQLLGTVVPIVVYWAYSGLYVLFWSFDDYRLHSRKDEDEKNLVSKATVVKGVLLQQAVQAIVATILFTKQMQLRNNIKEAISVSSSGFSTLKKQYQQMQLRVNINSGFSSKQMQH